ncbi:MAG: flagellar protein export ATPase FliI [Desulfatiglans sp.]|jgi:flagellum-specific ATP synthase|nr:flagellar protein export ATPase FliI [Thermodesulfobacteriota bacterium]MEE4354468.1 flagellar protein export ATPase FliI [Desulfatiglans sp.]
MIPAIDFQKYHTVLDESSPIRAHGKVTKVVGLITEAHGPSARLGSICEIQPKANLPGVMAEVIGFRNDKIVLMPLGEMRGIGPGSRVVAKQQKASIAVGSHLLGRVIDGLGNPIDGKGDFPIENEYPIYKNPMNPLVRKRISKPLDTGIRAISGLLSIGCGQRVGIFSGSGVGKSVLLGMIARKTNADVNVVALIGERGREVNEFLEKDLGEEGLKRSVVIVATSDHPPLIRMRGAFIATTIAEYFRDQGNQVLLMMDSVTRFAMAQREVGLAAGEPPTTKGYTPSVFTLLPRLLERAGTGSSMGTITGLYTVLVEADDMNEPIADAVRSILDGHIVLSRDLAMGNHYPAIDVLSSISRVMDDVVDPEQRDLAGRAKEILDTYKKAEDIINIGAYVSGSNPKIDYAISMIDRVNAYLKQGIDEDLNLQDSIQQLKELLC